MLRVLKRADDIATFIHAARNTRFGILGLLLASSSVAMRVIAAAVGRRAHEHYRLEPSSLLGVNVGRDNAAFAAPIACFLPAHTA